MSLANKCDVCGKYYDIGCDYICITHKSRLSYLGLTHNEPELDCCPDCSKVIEECITSRKMGKEPVYHAREDENND